MGIKKRVMGVLSATVLLSNLGTISASASSAVTKASDSFFTDELEGENTSTYKDTSNIRDSYYDDGWDNVNFDTADSTVLWDDLSWAVKANGQTFKLADVKSIAQTNYTKAKSNYASYSSISFGGLTLQVKKGLLYDKKTGKLLEANNPSSNATSGYSRLFISKGKVNLNAAEGYGVSTFITTLVDTKKTGTTAYKLYVFEGKVMKITTTKVTTLAKTKITTNIETSISTSATSVAKVKSYVKAKTKSGSVSYTSTNLKFSGVTRDESQYKIKKGLVTPTYNISLTNLGALKLKKGLVYNSSGSLVTGKVKLTPKTSSYTAYNLYIYKGKVINVTTSKGNLGLK